MLTMFILILLVAASIRVLGAGLRVFVRIAAWMIGAVVVLALIGGAIGLIGMLASLAFRLLPIVGLVALGVFIGRRLSNRGNIGTYREYDRIIDADRF